MRRRGWARKSLLLLFGGAGPSGGPGGGYSPEDEQRLRGLLPRHVLWHAHGVAEALAGSSTQRHRHVRRHTARGAILEGGRSRTRTRVTLATVSRQARGRMTPAAVEGLGAVTMTAKLAQRSEVAKGQVTGVTGGGATRRGLATRASAGQVAEAVTGASTARLHSPARDRELLIALDVL